MKSSSPTLINFVLLFCVPLYATVITNNHQIKSRDTVTIPGYVDRGCYTEATTGRALSDNAYYDNGMTVEKCAAACVSYNYFGVEYGQECYCGDAINAGSIAAPTSDCSFTCPGNSLETCGAGNRLNMYSKATPTEYLSTYTSKGCYSEGAGTRALSSKTTYSNAMTVELCAATCQGYALFGVEYYQECYCGDVLKGGSQPIDDSQCNFPCLGNPSEMCGSNWVMNLYSFDSIAIPVSSSSTASTKSSSSILSDSIVTMASSSTKSVHSSPSSSATTVSTSSSVSLTSASLNSSSSPASSSSSSSSGSFMSTTRSVPSTTQSSSPSSPLFSSSSSNTLSSANSSGSSSASVSSTSTSSTATSAISSSSTSSSLIITPTSISISRISTISSATATVLGVRPRVGPYAYIGCYTEATNMRALSQASFYDYHGMTLEICANDCAGYKYFGVEYAGECYCGNSINQGSIPAPPTDCALTCPGNNLEYCGDGLRLDMYELATAIPTSSSVTQTTPSSTATPTLGIKQRVGDFEYQGCYTEATTMRALTGAAHYDYPAMTLEECASDCAGYTYFGVEYHGECYCGNSLNPGSVITDDALCNYICPGNPFEYCGASRLLDMYKLSPPGPAHLALYVQPFEITKSYKREFYNTAIIVTGGGLVANCADANYFTLVNSSLYEAGLQVGANNGLPNELFWGTDTPGPIQSSFSIVNDTLQWANESFASGIAEYCVVDEILVAVFNGVLPSGCSSVYIGVANFTDFCPGGTEPATTTYIPVVATPTTTSTPVLPTCTASSDPETNVTLIPAADPGVDTTSPIYLSPSKYATLFYAEPVGTTVAEVEYAMLYPQVTLENSALIDNIICTANTILMNFTTNFGFLAATQWPQRDFVLITNSVGCNPSQQRGLYMVNSYVANSNSSSIIFQVTAQTWSKVATTMEVSYGTGVVTTNATSTLAPSCSSPVTPSSPSSSVTWANLTPDEKAIVILLTKNQTYDADGNIVKTVPSATNITAVPSAFNPTPDPAAQATLEDALQAAGLPSPGSLHNTTALNLAGHCSNGGYVPPTTIFSRRNSPTAQSQKPRFLSRAWALRQRSDSSEENDESWWQHCWDVLCDETVDDIIGALDENLGDYIELVCDLKELYDDLNWAYKNRAAIQCALEGCYMNVPVSEYWRFTSSWDASFDVPPQTLAQGSNGIISCVDCSLTVSSVQFDGKVTVSMTDGSLLGAYMTPTVSWNGNIVMSMSSTGPFSGQWNYIFNQLAFPSPIVVVNEFSITPSMIYSLGVEWSTDSAVDITGGGAVSVNSGSLYVDFQRNAVSQAASWTPNVQYTYPMFSTASTVSWNPIMRTSIEIDVALLNQPISSSPMYLTSSTSLGFNAALIETDGGYCTAGQLMMTSYSNITNSIKLNGQGSFPLYSASNVPGQTKCFTVPNDIPTVDEVNELRSSGAAFCTEYLVYSPRTVVAYAVTTLTVPSTVTMTVPTTVSTPVYVYTSPTVTSVSSQFTYVPTPIYVYTTGSQSLGDSFLRKRALHTPTTTLKKTTKFIRPTASFYQHDRRQGNEPAVIATWDATKISNACSQIATGTSTTTYYTSTATSTTTANPVTFTATTTIDVSGLVTTISETQTIWSVTATTITTGESATVTTASSCPLQTQISCFTLTGHGDIHIDNKLLFMAGGGPEAPIFGGWGYDPYWSTSFEVATFYLTCEGTLVNLDWNKALQPQGQMPWVIFPPWEGGVTGQTCEQDPVAKTLTCGAGWFSYGPTPNAITDTLQWQPVWNADYWSFGEAPVLTPIVLTYNEVICPCAY